MSQQQQQDEEDSSSVMKIKLLSVPEVFVYRIPPLKSAGGHRAEDWDLAKPLRTCSLLVERDADRDVCYVRLFVENTTDQQHQQEQSILFAQSILTLSDTSQKLEHFVEGVVDSSRYFVLRITKDTHTATIGLGFRERDDASNFRLALQDWERSIQRERKAQVLHEQYEKEEQQTEDKQTEEVTPIALSKLTLKEGETIHVNLGNKEKKSGKQPEESSSKPKAKTGQQAAGVLPLLKKPPPSPSVPTAKASQQKMVDEVKDIKDVSSASEIGSECAVASLTDDEEWQDFEPSSQYD